MATKYAIEFRHPVSHEWVRLEGYSFLSATAAILFRIQTLAHIRAAWRWIAI